MSRSFSVETTNSSSSELIKVTVQRLRQMSTSSVKIDGGRETQASSRTIPTVSSQINTCSSK